MRSETLKNLNPLLKDMENLGLQAEDAAWLAWNYLVEPGDALATALLAANDPQGALEQVDQIASGGKAGLDEIVGEHQREKLEKAIERWSGKEILATAGRSIVKFLDQGGTILTPSHRLWPEKLKDLGEQQPTALWVKGSAKIETLMQTSMAMVGARASTRLGDDIAANWSAQIARHGVTVLSGGAYGIDAAAHRGALTSGTTVAVMAGGIDRLYPAGNLELLEKIKEQGLIIAECPPTSAPTRWRFLNRNRLIAALSDACVVVEAGWRSGALATMRRAAEIGRPIGAVPGAITNVNVQGCLGAIRDLGANLLITAEDAIQLLPRSLTLFEFEDAPNVVESMPGLDQGIERAITATNDRIMGRVYEAIPKLSRISKQALTNEVGLSRIEVLGALGRLEMLGAIEVVDDCVKRAR